MNISPQISEYPLNYHLMDTDRRMRECESIDTDDPSMDAFIGQDHVPINIQYKIGHNVTEIPIISNLDTDNFERYMLRHDDHVRKYYMFEFIVCLLVSILTNYVIISFSEHMNKSSSSSDVVNICARLSSAFNSFESKILKCS